MFGSIIFDETGQVPTLVPSSSTNGARTRSRTFDHNSRPRGTEAGGPRGL